MLRCSAIFATAYDATSVHVLKHTDSARFTGYDPGAFLFIPLPSFQIMVGGLRSFKNESYVQSVENQNYDTYRDGRCSYTKSQRCDPPLRSPAGIANECLQEPEWLPTDRITSQTACLVNVVIDHWLHACHEEAGWDASESARCTQPGHFSRAQTGPQAKKVYLPCGAGLSLHGSMNSVNWLARPEHACVAAT